MRLGAVGIAVVVGVMSFRGTGPRGMEPGGKEAEGRNPGRQADKSGDGPRGEAEMSAGGGDRRVGPARRPAPLPSGSGTVQPGEGGEETLSEEAVWAHYEPTHEELVYRAMKVEQEAARELRNLLQVLDLDEESQDRVFAALVRSSEYYHPSLQATGVGGAPLAEARGPAGGETSPGPVSSPRVEGTAPAAEPAVPSGTGTPRDEVVAVLTPEQADVYERYTSERAAFWVGVVEDAEQELSTVP